MHRPPGQPPRPPAGPVPTYDAYDREQAAAAARIRDLRSSNGPRDSGVLDSSAGHPEGTAALEVLALVALAAEDAGDEVASLRQASRGASPELQRAIETAGRAWTTQRATELVDSADARVSSQILRLSLPSAARELVRGQSATDPRVAELMSHIAERFAKDDTGVREPLTPDELQVARLVATGGSNREIASHLSVSPRAIDGHLESIFRKLRIQSRDDLSALSGVEAALPLIGRDSESDEPTLSGG